MKHVGRELGVRYVLEGSVRKGGGRVRITAQLVSPSKSCIAGTDAKRPRSSKQFTLTTARTPSLKSATAAINTPQRRQMRKSQVRVPNRYRSTSDQSSAPTHGSWLNLVEGFFSKLMAS